MTLLRVFLAASAAILCLGALAISTLLGRALETQALEDARVSLTQYVNGVLHDELVQDGKVVGGAGVSDVVERELANRSDILSVKVWAPDGTLAWTSLAPERIGTRYPVAGHLAEAVRDGHAEAELEALGQHENEAEAQLGVDRAVEVYAPILGTRGTPIGAYEIYADAERLEATVQERSRQLWLVVLAVFALLWAALALLVRGASRRLQRQTQALKERSAQLMESYRELEQSSLDAIETLNATVEAKDPYTAGHSARVQRIAVALGGELELDATRLATLGHAALFHDIGKLAVPDAVLTKPAALDEEEYELIKKHSEKGAEIVGKLGRLRGAVPLIRHHHERWDGKGYPDALRGDEIPLEAAIIGLADAWDAMTTDRPYHRALTLDEAYAEVRGGRGTQFSPAVVDAFLVVARRNPFELLRMHEGEDDAPAAELAAG